MGNADGSIGGQGGAGGGGGHTQFDLLRELSHIRHELTLINRKFPSLRDQLAMAALQGIYSSSVAMEAIHQSSKQMGLTTHDMIGIAAYGQADDMLKAREKGASDVPERGTLSATE